MEAKSYKDTVNLPKTKFDMRANAARREPELQQFWADREIYDRLSQNNPGDLFILHDGPPYANGQLHIGHALNKILKDFINRYQMLRGKKVRYVPGWDCHGLPIELKVLQNMKSAERLNLTPTELRHKAAAFAQQTMEQQRDSFQRYGIWGDWKHPYLTMKPEYEAAQIGVFGQMVLKGYIYRGFKPVHWSPSSKTALAEAELEYPEGHTSRSIYVGFHVRKLSKSLQSKVKRYMPSLWAAIWTTTPWTIPANLAIAVNPELTYAVVEPSANSHIAQQFMLVAVDAVDRLSATLNTELKILATFPGKELEGCTYKHSLFDRESPIVAGGDYITADSGTGLVHTAPGHGQEDFIVGKRCGLPILTPVDENGNFTAEAGEFAGLNVLGDGNSAVIEALEKANSLIKEESYAHSYPYDWRTKKPTIFRATEQWFASVEGFRDQALKAISNVNWIPAQGENRITAMVGDRSDWCISRQRTWGVPIPVFYDEETNEPLLNEETIAHVQAIFADKGSDAWWELSIAELLPESYRDNGRTYRKGTDTMDVWFDSGSSWAAVVKGRSELNYPADIYLEGSDQHRGWFQSSLLTSVATNGIAPYKTVLTHGFVLDEKGRKMSKSEGNVVDPAVVIKEYGADVLRLWVSSVDYSADVPLGKNILKQQSDVYRKIRNTAKFLLGNLHDFDPAKDAVAYEDLPELDRYMLHRMGEVFAEVKDAFDSFQFSRFFQTVQNFCTVDLSNFYLDIAKDRLYISATDAQRRRSCQTVIAIAVENLARAIAPVLCHMAEDIWQYLPYPTPYKSVFEAGWVQLDDSWHNPELAARWQYLRQVRGEVNKVLEQARTEKVIGSSLEAKVLLYVPDVEKRQQLQVLNPSSEELMDYVRSQNSVIELAAAEKAKAVQDRQEEQAANVAKTLTIKTVSDQEKTVAKRDRSSEIVEYSAPEESALDLQQMLDRSAQFVADLPAYAGNFFTEYQKLLVTLGLLASVLVTGRVTLAILDTMNQIPMLGGLFEIIGILFTIWFAFRHLLWADNRQKMAETIDSLTADVLGQTTALVLAETKAIVLAPAVETALVPIQAQTSAAQPSFAETPAIPKAELSVEPQPETPAEVAVHHHSETGSNGVDELRYLFITSEVELVESNAILQELPYSYQSPELAIGVVKADGQKCDRCWNYSTHLGESIEHPAICERCVSAVDGKF
ncbi:isoleucine--tRNA ligase [Microcoleus sp. LEGE 07076]|uniref:isoleucine--tRNA ligase n=1 Tax=Microcoleus sp. LEGE 07076 TaxID=915322 RepID=UPI00187F1E8B|nr:isoleucine--tRNA ligase [Microcoleus sp. LEGE 07076]MBE9185463.1 isoleucine--tRNA ligase [Microcoleus sp. LEGE 07076]